MINWKQKLSSRKFWAALVSYTTGMLAAWGANDNAVARTAAILTGIGALVTYILAESYVDVKRAEASPERGTEPASESGTEPAPEPGETLQ